MIKPIGDRIIVKQAVQKSDKLLLESEEREYYSKGEVLAVGVDCDALEKGLKIGDTIYFAEQSGERIKHDGEEYLIIRLRDAIAYAE